MTDCLHNFLGESACEHCGMCESDYANERVANARAEGAAEMQARIVGIIRSKADALHTSRRVAINHKDCERYAAKVSALDNLLTELGKLLPETGILTVKHVTDALTDGAEERQAVILKWLRDEMVLLCSSELAHAVMRLERGEHLGEPRTPPEDLKHPLELKGAAEERARCARIVRSECAKWEIRDGATAERVVEALDEVVFSIEYQTGNGPVLSPNKGQWHGEIR